LRSKTLLLALAFITAISPASAQAPVPATASRTLRPVIDLVLDARGSADSLLIGRTSALTFDATGRIYVADGLDHTVRVYSPKGVLMYRLGREKSRPSEMLMPCCLTIRADTLWIKERSDDRFSEYLIGTDSATYVRHLLKPDAVITHASAIPKPPVDTLAFFTVHSPGKYSRFAIPGHPVQLRAFDQSGNAAFAMNSTYSVRWIDAQGNLLAQIEQQVKPIALSAQERAVMEAQIANAAAGAGVPRDSIKRQPPSIKLPLTRLAFDHDGRLWVFRAVAPGQPQQADVYDRTGTLWAVVQWPPTLIMTNAAFSGTGGLALQRDVTGAERVVRVQLK
jgi:hypothetical protein